MSIEEYELLESEFISSYFDRQYGNRPYKLPTYSDVIEWSMNKQKEEDVKEFLYMVNRTNNRIRKEIIDKAHKWLSDHCQDYSDSSGETNWTDLLEDFRKAIK